MKNIKKLTVLSLFSIFISHGPQSFADEACSIIETAQGATPVIFFGGWLAQESDGQKWAQAATHSANKSCSGAYKFEGHGLNGAESKKASVEVANAQAIQSCVQKIQNYKGKIKLVGHSDGSWLVNAIVDKLVAADRKKVELVLKDGNFKSSWGPQGPPANVICETSSPTKIDTCSEIQWPPHKSDDPPYTTNMMTGVCSGNCQPRVSVSRDCPQNIWRTHFGLVSSSAPCNLTVSKNSNFNAQVYKENMMTPLDFLECGSSGFKGSGKSQQSTP